MCEETVYLRDLHKACGVVPNTMCQSPFKDFLSNQSACQSLSQTVIVIAWFGFGSGRKEFCACYLKNIGLLHSMSINFLK